MKRDDNNYRQLLANLIAVDPELPLSELIEQCAQRGFHGLKARNHGCQALRKLAREFPDYTDSVFRTRTQLRRTNYSPFHFRIVSAFHGDSGFIGTVQLFICGREILPPTHISHISVSALADTLTKPMILNPITDPPPDDYATLTTGCGWPGCCPALFFSARRNSDVIEIKSIFWSTTSGYGDIEYLKIGASKLCVPIQAVQQEIQRLDRMDRICTEKSNIVPWKNPTQKFLKNRRRLKKIEEALESNKQRSWWRFWA